MTPANGTTYYTRCKGGRVTYDETGNFGRGTTSKPYRCFRDGTATISFGALAPCVEYFRKYGMVLVVE